MPSNVYAENYSSIEGKVIIFYDDRYNRAFTWHGHNEGETIEVIRAWTAVGVPAVGLFEGWYVDSREPKLVPFDGHTTDDLKRYLSEADLRKLEG
jgi:hypothetical protein